MITTDLNIAQLYYRYGKTSDKEIREQLDETQLVLLKHEGPGTTFGYYPLTKGAQENIAPKPRVVSFRYGTHETARSPMTDLKEYKKIPYLVKSSSRFFLKDDIGEVFDQIELEDKWSEIKAIAVTDDYQELPGTEGEHFIRYAILFK